MLLDGLLPLKCPDLVFFVFFATLSFVSCASLERCFEKKRESQQQSVTLMQLLEIVGANKRFVVVSQALGEVLKSGAFAVDSPRWDSSPPTVYLVGILWRAQLRKHIKRDKLSV